MPSNAAYPQRSSHFAHRFCRLLASSEAAAEIGPEGCWLLALIVHQEDALRYQRPVNFWNGQLMRECGCPKDRLIRIRRRAVEAGWLHYQPGRKGTPGTYWVTVPEHISGFSGSDSVANCDGKQDAVAPAVANCAGRTHLRSHLQSQNHDAFNPNPINTPIPNKRFRDATKNKPKKERFRKPTLEEVKAYCNEAGLNIDPQRFVDYYEAAGWTIGKGKPMKDWKAAVRLWAQNEERWKHEQPSTTKRTSAGFR